MGTRIHYYGSTFELSDARDDASWRATIQSHLEQAAMSGAQVGAWFDLKDGGHVSFWIYADTPLAVSSD